MANRVCELAWRSAVPRTSTGKDPEVPVKRILQGGDATEVTSRNSLDDPDILEPYVSFARRHSSA